MVRHNIENASLRCRTLTRHNINAHPEQASPIFWTSASPEGMPMAEGCHNKFMLYFTRMT